MANTAFPSAADLASFLSGGGFGDFEATQLGPYVSAAATEFLNRCGWPSFLPVEGSAFTYRPPEYTARGYVLDIGAWRSVASVTIGNKADGSDGVALTLGTDYLLLRLGDRADSEDRPNPFVEIDLRGRVGYVTLSGVEGYASAVPPDAWLAVLKRAAVLALEDRADAATNLKRVKQDKVEIEYQSGASDFATRWTTDFQKAVTAHARL